MIVISRFDTVISLNFILSIILQLTGFYLIYLLSVFGLFSLRSHGIERIVNNTKLRLIMIAFSSRAGKLLIIFLATQAVFLLINLMAEAFNIYDIRLLPSRDILTWGLALTSLLIALGLYVFLGGKGLLVKLDDELSVSIDGKSSAAFHLRKKRPKIDVTLLVEGICESMKILSALGFREFKVVSWRLARKQQCENLVVKEMRKVFRKTRINFFSLLGGAVFASLLFVFSGAVAECWSSAILILSKVVALAAVANFSFGLFKMSILLKVIPIPEKTGVLESFVAQKLSSFFAASRKTIKPRHLRLSTLFTLSVVMPHIKSTIGGVESGFVITMEESQMDKLSTND